MNDFLKHRIDIKDTTGCWNPVIAYECVIHHDTITFYIITKYGREIFTDKHSVSIPYKIYAQFMNWINEVS